MNPILLQIILLFLARQLAKWGPAIKWDLVKKDLGPRIRAFIPGDKFDAIAEFIAFLLIDLVAFGISQGQTLEQAWENANGQLPRALAQKALNPA